MLSVIIWWLAIQVLGLAALPLTWRLFARLPGRGYAFTKPLGLLLAAYSLWLGATFHLLPNNAGGILVSLVVVTALSAWLGRDALRRGESGGRPLVDWLSANRWQVLATELLLLVVFCGWSAFRAYTPDIAGTEKPMEFAFINGVLNSRFFPPQDPWLSGYAISYYYFGYVMLGLLTRITGVLPEVGFNIGVAMWFGLVMVAAYGIVLELVALASRQLVGSGAGEGPAAGIARPIRWGFLGAVFVGVSGNLEGIVDAAYQRGILPASFVQWIDIKGLTEAPPTGNWTGGFWWWWRASRVIHDKDLLGNSVEVIDEFPFFSFLLGDLHPHVLAYPFVLLAIALALNLLLGSSDIRSVVKALPPGPAGVMRSLLERLGAATGLGLPGVFLYAVVLGGLAFLNTWDFPIYVALAALAFGLGPALVRRPRIADAGSVLGSAIALGGLGWVLYLPFYVGFQSQLGGILPNLLFPSRFSQFFLMFGIFLSAAVLFLALQTWRARSREMLPVSLVSFLVVLAGPVLLLALIAAGMAALPAGQAAVREALQNPAVQANVPSASLSGLLALAARLRFASPWTYVVVALLTGWTVGVLWGRVRRCDTPRQDGLIDEETRRPDVFAILLIAFALLLAFVPEFVYLRDLFGTRMNTVFKFYYQAWAMLAVASAYGLARLVGRTTPRALSLLSIVVVGVLALCGLWYPLAATPSKADNFQGQPTLDGLAFLRRSNPADMAAIEWLRANVAPAAVVLEASGGSYSPEGAGRVSMSTGNPTLLGWDFHERQWRGNEGYDRAASDRPEVLEQIYRTASVDTLRALLNRWSIEYVYIGALERNKYRISDPVLERFDGVMTRVYDQDGVRIYAR